MTTIDAGAAARELLALRKAGGGAMRTSFDSGLRAFLLVVIWGFSVVVSVVVGRLLGGEPGLALGLFVGVGPGLGFAIWASSIVRVAAQWERAVMLRLGKFHSVKGPGVIFVFPVLDNVQLIDTRLLTMAIPHQQVITRDNVPVTIDGALFFQVRDPQLACIAVQDYRSAIMQYAQAALRDVAGQMSLDEILSERDKIQAQIAHVVESRSTAWGLHVDAIRLLDINMPEDLKRMMSRQASAEREKRATITKAEGDREAALNLAEAAKTMATSPGAMQLRTLQSLDGLGSSPSNTVVLAVPVEVLELAKSLASLKRRDE